MADDRLFDEEDINNDGTVCPITAAIVFWSMLYGVRLHWLN